MNLLIGLLIPFIGTTLGSAMVFLMKDKLNNKLEKFLLGFASGIMIAASIWSLLIPSMELSSKQNNISWFPAAIGFLLGTFFLLLLDILIPHLHNNSVHSEGVKSKISKSLKMFLAVTIHNIPEGMAIGVSFAAYLSNNSITLTSAFALAVGIAIQNFPEGAIISMPLKDMEHSKFKSFIMGVLSGIVEPIFAYITILLTNLVVPLLPYFLSFAAGAMIYVVTEELIPESNSGDHSNLAVIGLSLGFVLMMILDTIFS